MPTAPDRLTTARLVGVRIAAADRAFYRAIWQDPRVVATLGGSRPLAVIDARVDRQIAAWDAHGFGVYTLHEDRHVSVDFIAGAQDGTVAIVEANRMQGGLRPLNLRNARRIERTIIELQGLFIKVGQLISIMANFLPEAFRREFAAWLGLTPLQNSSGGKERMGRISKMGDKYLRKLLVVGATSLVRRARHGDSGRASSAHDGQVEIRVVAHD